MRRLLGHLLATLLTASLSATVILWTLGATLASPSFLESTADQTHLYDQLSAAAPGSDPATIRTGVNSALPQIIDYVVNGGPGPSLNIPGVTSGPVALTQDNPKLTAAGHELHLAAEYLPVAALLLAVLIIVFMGRLRWHTLARAVFAAALSLGISAAIFWFVPNFITQNSLKTLPDNLKSGVAQFITAVLHALSTHLAYTAIILLGVSLLFSLAHLIERLRTRFAKEPKPHDALPPPTGNVRS
jgi:hypothetical protein